MKKWYDSGKSNNHILISSRVRLARNLCSYPFSIKLGADDARRMVDEVRTRFYQQFAGAGEFYDYYDLSEMNLSGRKALEEQYIITPLLAEKKAPAGAIVSKDASESIMLNEEDHIRIQTVAAGDEMGAVYTEASRLDDLLCERLEYAYNHKYGYITSCPTSIGTGLRAAYLMHLPFLEKEKMIKPLSDELNRLGFMLRGTYGEGEAFGSIYQISNQKTLGMTEEEILSSLKNMMVQITDHERGARERCLRKHRPEIEDLIFRSYGILKYGRSFTANEAMAYLSNVRVGMDEAILTPAQPPTDIFGLMVGIQPATLASAAGKRMGTADRHSWRAEYIHKNLPQIAEV